MNHRGRSRSRHISLAHLELANSHLDFRHLNATRHSEGSLATHSRPGSTSVCRSQGHHCNREARSGNERQTGHRPLRMRCSVLRPRRTSSVTRQTPSESNLHGTFGAAFSQYVPPVRLAPTPHLRLGKILGNAARRWGGCLPVLDQADSGERRTDPRASPECLSSRRRRCRTGSRGSRLVDVSPSGSTPTELLG